VKAADFAAARERALGALMELARGEPGIEALWLQGSLADGLSDPLSDIDAYVAVRDDAFDDLYARRAAFVATIAPPLAWSDATTPGLTAVHALIAGPVKLDLFFERVSALGAQKRPAVRVLFDKTDCTQALNTAYEPPRAHAAIVLGVMIRMQRQGALWPLRVLMRGQAATYATMILDLINRELALLMAVQASAQHIHTNPFSLSRQVSPAEAAELDALTAEALSALAAHDDGAMRRLHLRVFDALVREGRAACAAYAIPYPMDADADAALRDILATSWPGRNTVS